MSAKFGIHGREIWSGLLYTSVLGEYVAGWTRADAGGTRVSCALQLRTLFCGAGAVQR